MALAGSWHTVTWQSTLWQSTHEDNCRGGGGEAMVVSRELLTLGEQVGARLKARGETVGVAESASGGLVAQLGGISF